MPLLLLGGIRVDTPNLIAAWSSNSKLAEARSYAVAVEVAGHQLLVVGGLDPASSQVTLRRAEFVDEVTGTSVEIDGPRIARIGASLTVLGNGNVLLVAGAERVEDSWNDLASVEIFDVRTRRWRDTVHLHGPRANHGAVLLGDGRVLIAGGQLGTLLLDSAELFDPASETWTRAARLPETRAYFSFATLPDGRALLAGGLAAAFNTRTSLLYDPRRDRWERGPELAIDRVLNATVTLANGDVLLAGGQLAAAGTAERFDVRSGTFKSAGTLVWPRMIPLAARLADGRVIVAGGLPRPVQILDHFAPMATTEVFDPETNVWAPGPELPVGVAVGALVSTRMGVWLLGGAVEDEVAVDAIHLLR